MMVRLIERKIKYWISFRRLFQFHDGAIDSQPKLHDHIFELNRFNSMMVRLIEARFEGDIYDLSSFNSMMVRLIVYSLEYEIEYVEFQFHDGAIDSKNMKSFFKSELLFQFHDGAIDSLRRFWWRRPCSKFQFHDGAIDRVNKIYLLSGSGVFQFHDGAIDRSYHNWNNWQPDRFQFHDGAIDSFFLRSASALSMCFNSMMVRLIACVKLSHIKDYIVSIPWWCDW